MISLLDFLEKPENERQEIINGMIIKELKEFIGIQSQFIVDKVIKRNVILKVNKEL